MSYDLHFGTRTRLDPAAAEQLEIQFGPNAEIYQDRDGWETWGDAPGTDRNDADTLHTIVRIETIGAAIDAAVNIAGGALDDLAPVPMSRQSQARSIGVVAVVTDTDDWSIDHALTYYSGVLRLIDSTTTFDVL